MSVGGRHCTVLGEAQCGDETRVRRTGPLPCRAVHLAEEPGLGAECEVRR